MYEDNKNNRLIGRKCPSCQSLIERYTICGIYMPIENKGLLYYNNFSNDSKSAFMQIGAVSLTEVYSLYFMSQCLCGFVSMWELTKEEVEYILRTDTNISLSWLYNQSAWRDFLSEVKDQDIKKEIEATLGMILQSYGEAKPETHPEDKN